MTTDIIHVEPQLTELAISPESFQQAVDDAAAKARILSEIVESQKLYTMMGPSKHLQVEAWETIAKGYGCTAAVRTSEILYTPDGVEVGAKAYAVVYDQNGVVRGSAEGYCMRDERNWGAKPIFQLISMAGTRAVSKSLRLMFSWVVVLAGYSPTPAEEMIQDTRDHTEKPAQHSRGRQASTRQGATGQGRCEEHKKPWGNTPDGQIGHPYGNGQWCYKLEQMQAEADAENAAANAEPAMENLADLKLALDTEGWDWEQFQDTVLECLWEEWEQLSGEQSVKLAWDKLQKYQEI